MLQEEEYDSDTSDEDFVPEGVVESEDDAVSDGDDDDNDSGDGDIDADKKGKKKKKQRRKSKQKKKSTNVEKEEEETEKEEIKEVDKKKEESIWADFLADVEDKPSPPPKPKASSWGALLGNKRSSNSTTTTTAQSAKPQSAPKREDKESSSKQETVKITQVFEFAGEEVRVEKEVDANSVEAQAAKCSTALSSESKASPGVGGAKRSVGLAGLVGLLDNKKQKLTTLEKTKLDWNAFKSEEGIDSELEKHKKSKDGYLDKQAFLERADLRQFEIERAMRMSKRSNR